MDLFAAARRGAVPALRSLLRPEAECDADLRDDWGQTALMLAAEAGRTDCVALLLAAGADVGAQDAESGYTALHRALLSGQVAAAAMLVRVGGASVDSPLDHEGLSPLALCELAHGPAETAEAALAGDVYTWGQAGGLPLGRPAATGSHEARPARAKLPAPPSSLEEGALTAAAAARGETADPRGVVAVAAAKHHTLFADARGAPLLVCVCVCVRAPLLAGRSDPSRGL